MWGKLAKYRGLRWRDGGFLRIYLHLSSLTYHFTTAQDRKCAFFFLKSYNHFLQEEKNFGWYLNHVWNEQTPIKCGAGERNVTLVRSFKTKRYFQKWRMGALSSQNLLITKNCLQRAKKVGKRWKMPFSNYFTIRGQTKVIEKWK